MRDGDRHPDGEEMGLLESAMRREPEAIRLVWDRHRRWVAALLLAHMPRQADLEDLLQEVAITFVRRVGELRDPAALRPWLRTVAINTARLAGRKQTLARRHGEKLRILSARTQDPPEAPDVGSAQREEAQRLLGLALELPDAYREPLLLRCLHGMSYREIHEITGLPETTIETRIARGRRMLRERAGSQETVGRPIPPSTPGATSDERSSHDRHRS